MRRAVNGRVDPADVLMMEQVLDAIAVQDMPFAAIVNQVPEGQVKRLLQVPEVMARFMKGLNSGVPNLQLRHDCS